MTVKGVFDIRGVIVKIVTHDYMERFNYDIILDSTNKEILERLNAHKDKIQSLSIEGINIVIDYFNDNTLKGIHVIATKPEYKTLANMLAGVVIGFIN